MIGFLTRNDRDAAIEKSLDAAIELEGMRKGTRNDAPAFKDLLMALFGSGEPSQQLIDSSLSNSSTVSLYSRTLSAATHSSYDTVAALRDILLDYVVADHGVARDANARLASLVEFCVSLNSELVSDAYKRVSPPAIPRESKRLSADAY